MKKNFQLPRKVNNVIKEFRRGLFWDKKMNILKYLPQGKHVMAEFSNCDPEFLVYKKYITKKILMSAVKKSNAKILEAGHHVFPGGGYSLVMNLSESHFSIHTYPEFRAVFVDCFTCGKNCHPEKTLEFIKNKFNASGKIRVVKREIKI